MKRNLIGILSLVVISVMMNAAAQASSVTKADVPFAFKVGKAQLPAGTYEIQAATDNSVKIKNRDGKAGAMALVQYEDPSEHGRQAGLPPFGWPIFPRRDLGSPGYHEEGNSPLQTRDEPGEGTARRRPTQRQRSDLDSSV